MLIDTSASFFFTNFAPERKQTCMWLPYRHIRNMQTGLFDRFILTDSGCKARKTLHYAWSCEWFCFFDMDKKQEKSSRLNASSQPIIYL